MSNELRERLADYAHEAWSGWMRYMFGRSNVQPDGSITIPPHLVERWQRQMTTPYAGLPEEEKASDRKEADQVIDVFLETRDEANMERYCRGFNDGYDLARCRFSGGQDAVDDA